MKKAGTLKRILSILMAVFIVFGFAPDSVFAAPKNGVVKDDECEIEEDTENVSDEITEEETVISEEKLISQTDPKGKNTNSIEGEENVVDAGNSNLLGEGSEYKIPRDIFDVKVKKVYMQNKESTIEDAVSVTCESDEYTIKYSCEKEGILVSSNKCPSLSYDSNLTITVWIYEEDDENAKYYESFSFIPDTDLSVTQESSDSIVFKEDEDGVSTQNIPCKVKDSKTSDGYTYSYILANDSEAEEIKNETYVMDRDDLAARDEWSNEANIDDAGDYCFFVKISRSNQKADDGTTYIYDDFYTTYKVSVGKATINLEFDNDTELISIGSGKDVYCDYTVKTKGWTGEVQYSIKSFDSPYKNNMAKMDDTVFVEETGREYNTTGVIRAFHSGTVEVEAHVEESDNYKAATISRTFTFQKDDEAAIYFEVSPVEVIIKPTLDKNSINATLAKESQKVLCFADPKNASDFKCTYSLSDDKNGVFAINASNGTVQLNSNKNTNFLYDGISSLFDSDEPIIELEVIAHSEGYVNEYNKTSKASTVSYKIHIGRETEVEYTDPSVIINWFTLVYPDSESGWFNKKWFTDNAVESVDFVMDKTKMPFDAAPNDYTIFQYETNSFDWKRVFKNEGKYKFAVPFINYNTVDLTNEYANLVSEKLTVPCTDPGYIKIDKTLPEVTGVSYSTPAQTKNQILYYPMSDDAAKQIAVAIKAKDDTSGLAKCRWRLEDVKNSTASAPVAVEGFDWTELDGFATNGEGTINLPTNIEYYGRLVFEIYDVAGNVQEYKGKILDVGDSDNNCVVVDGKAPSVEVAFSPVIPDDAAEGENFACKTYEDIDPDTNTKIISDYYRTNVNVDIRIQEEYFYPDEFNELMEITLIKDGEPKELHKNDLTFTLDSPEESDNDTTIRTSYSASFELEDEGLYQITIKAHDYAGNEMNDYVSQFVIIDKTAPVIEANISEPHYFDSENKVGYYGTNYTNPPYAQATATIEIVEENFVADDVMVFVLKNGKKLTDTTIAHEFVDKNSKESGSNSGEGGDNGDNGEGEDDNSNKGPKNPFGKLFSNGLSVVRNIVGGTGDSSLSDVSSDEDASEDNEDASEGNEDTSEGNEDTSEGNEDTSEEDGEDDVDEDEDDEDDDDEDEDDEDDDNDDNDNDDNHSTDVIKHVSELTISSSTAEGIELKNNVGDGEYTIVVTYTDRAGNVMTYMMDEGTPCQYVEEGSEETPIDCYMTNKLVLDTIAPEVTVTYSSSSPKHSLKSFFDDNTYKYYNQKTLSAVAVVKEANFNFEYKDEKGNRLFVPDFTAKNVQGDQITDPKINVDFTNAKSNGNSHELNINYSSEANFSFDCECYDLAGNKAVDYKTDYFTLDHTEPTITSIKYSTPVLDTVLNGITFGFYNNKINVTVEAEDNVAGIHEYNYSYIKAAGVSGVNAELRDQVVSEDKIDYSEKHKKASITFAIPKDALDANHQFNGTVKVSVSDRSDNSRTKEDDKRLVADNIAPNATVTYNAPIAENNGKVYYASDINGTITINEANFYASDVQILVTKNGAENAFSTSWTDESTDVHVGRFTLVEEGEYIVKINYKDKSSNAMNEYVSELMVIDKTIEAPAFKINGVNKDGDNGGAYKENLNVVYEFSDQNFKSATTKLTKTRFDEKNDITEQYIKTTTTANGGNGTFDIAKDVDSDGIYLLEVSMSDYAGHTIDSFVKFTANRYGSVYEYSDYLAWIISDGGQFIKLTGDETVTEDLVITEYNPDMVESGSLNITATRDGEAFDVFFTTTPSDMNRSAEPSSNSWYKYVYTISKQNFQEDGTYKLSISSSDATGNTSISVPENSIDSNGNKILDVMGFTVDTTCPELKNIINLEDSVIRSSNLEVKYSIVDLGGIKSIEAYVDGQPVATAADLTVGLNNYNGSFFVGESDVAQEVRIVIEDIAGNVTDTDDAQWKQEQERAGSYVFKNPVTVSTNFMVLWLANKLVFFGSIGAASVLVIGGAIFIIAKKAK